MAEIVVVVESVVGAGRGEGVGVRCEERERWRFGDVGDVEGWVGGRE